jgi:hypothetical protein
LLTIAIVGLDVGACVGMGVVGELVGADTLMQVILLSFGVWPVGHRWQYRELPLLK